MIDITFMQAGVAGIALLFMLRSMSMTRKDIFPYKKRLGAGALVTFSIWFFMFAGSSVCWQMVAIFIGIVGMMIYEMELQWAYLHLSHSPSCPISRPGSSC